MAGLGWQELVIVLVIIMIIFGAGKLPEIAKSLGQGVKEFREEAQAPVVPATTRTTGTATEETLRSDADGVRVVTAEETVDETGETVRVEEVRTGASSRDAI
ncbi:MAG: twin-arginine translocase TatA/TatE family subunit [Chloroflexi bacterium]|nr:twin-arginine translocase TatA/TatE family subunit [Chloroflexota bacterium]